MLWLVTGGRLSSPRAERRAQQLIAASFLLLAAYVTVESARDLIGAHHPAGSWVGVGLSAITLAAMPPLAAAKQRVGTALGSPATTTSESRQTMLCAYLSAALLVGLLANAVAGWWWAYPWSGRWCIGQSRPRGSARPARAQLRLLLAASSQNHRHPAHAALPTARIDTLDPEGYPYRSCQLTEQRSTRGRRWAIPPAKRSSNGSSTDRERWSSWPTSCR